MSKVTRRINDAHFAATNNEFKKIKNSLSEELPFCSIHNEAVSDHTIPYENPNPNGAPNIVIVLSGCCDEAIDKEI
jgi:hypothetical protein